MITIPCDYDHPAGTPCENGKVLIYGEMGGRLPETIDCPKCHGEGKIKVKREDIEQKINDLQGDIDDLVCEVERLQNLLL